MPGRFDHEEISVYGYDISMLDDVLSRKPECRNNRPSSGSIIRNHQEASARCKLLELPIEIRSQIFDYVLPRTIKHGSKDVCWIKGTTALLAVSKQIHEEASCRMYSSATFLLNTVWDCTIFECRSLLPSRLTPSRTYAFPDRLSPRYLSLIQSFKIVIHLYDSYFGMIKSNLSNLGGLIKGLRNQVETLCAILSSCTNVKRIHINFRNGSYDSPKADEVVLEPFLSLSNPLRFEVSGDVSEETRRKFNR